MKIVLGIFLGLALSYLCFTIPLKKVVYSATERAYFEGQFDYAKGDIRINTGECMRIKTPRDNGNNPRYLPEKKDCNIF